MGNKRLSSVVPLTTLGMQWVRFSTPGDWLPQKSQASLSSPPWCGCTQQQVSPAWIPRHSGSLCGLVSRSGPYKLCSLCTQAQHRSTCTGFPVLSAWCPVQTPSNRSALSQSPCCSQQALVICLGNAVCLLLLTEGVLGIKVLQPLAFIHLLWTVHTPLRTTSLRIHGGCIINHLCNKLVESHWCQEGGTLSLLW